MGVTIAFLGTGLIGGSLAQAALKRDQQITVWNRSVDKTAALVEAGAQLAATPLDAAREASRLHIALTADDAVDAVLQELQTSAAKEGLTLPPIIDHSTTLPQLTAKRAERCAAAGLAFLHAPVFMSPAACLEASGLMLAAGSRDLFQQLSPALQAMTGRLWYVGERGDLAAAFKLMGNALIVSILGGLADVYAIGRNLGIDGPNCHELFQHFDASMGIKGRGGRMARGDFDTQWSLAMARKDVGLMVDAAGEEAILSILPALAARMDVLIEEGAAGNDVGVLARSSLATKPAAE